MTEDPTPNSHAPRRLTLRAQRYDASACPFEATIRTNRYGGVEVSDAATSGRRGTALIVDFADVDALCSALRAAAMDAANRHVEFFAEALASTAIYCAQQSAARTDA